MKLMIGVVSICLLSPLVAIGAGCRDNLQPNSAIEEVGLFRNINPNRPPFFYVRGEDGYYMDIELWRANDCFFGRLSATKGSEGDPFFGHMDDFLYDQKTKKVVFRAKLSTEYPKELFEFTGTFNYKQFSGTMMKTDKGDNPVPTEKQNTIFKLVKGGKSVASTYGKWLESANEPKWLGPKW